jgi:hypothetical protein
MLGLLELDACIVLEGAWTAGVEESACDLQQMQLDRFQLRDSFTMSFCQHALRLGGEFQQYTAHGLINVFGTGTIIHEQRRR